MTTRRELLLALVSGVLVEPFASFAQQSPDKIYRIGFIWPTSASLAQLDMDAIMQRLRELGHTQGRNFVAEYRWAEGNSERLNGFASELVSQKVDLIVTRGTQAALAAKLATREIPIVFSMVSDPVATGIVTNLGRPGGNMTGWSNMLPDTSGKLLELLKEAAPRTVRVAVLWDPANPGKPLEIKAMKKAAAQFGLTFQSMEVRTTKDVEIAFSEMGKQRPDALIALSDTITNTHRQRIVEFAAKNRLPAIYQVREFVDAGGLMSYGLNIVRQHGRTAEYVDKILKGAKPAGLPVEQPTQFELVINVRTAKELGIKIPQSILVRADKVIE